jgi:hypothetical protein
MADQRTIYIHTINDEPAVFDGNEIVYASPYKAGVPAESLAQIKREQRASYRYRQSDEVVEYGYRRFLV